MRSALIAADMLNRCEHGDADLLMESVREALQAMERRVAG